MKKVTVDPITRLEGHGKIEIFVDDDNKVQNVYFQIPELRGFERFCVGRPVEELARITPRICGVCPEAHHMAATKAIDQVFGVEVAPAGRKLRELLYNTFYVTDHTTHFYILAGPDFIMGPESDPAARNILGVIGKVGMETAGAMIKLRAEAAEVISMIGGKQIHPVCGLPGGVSQAITAEQRDRIVEVTAAQIEFAKFTLKLFDDIVLGNGAYVDLIKSDMFTHETYYMGMVDENNKVNFYDGKIRVVGPDGVEHEKFEGKDYLAHLAEHVEPYSYLVYPYLKSVGWKGFVDGKDSGVYRASPLSRLNAADGMATPLAQAEYERFYSTLGGKPVHATDALGAPRGAALRGRARPRARHRPGDHRPERAQHPHAHRRRGCGSGRGSSRHALPSLQDRRQGHRHQRQPHRRHDQQQRRDLDVAQEGRRRHPHRRQGDQRGQPQHDRDGLPRLRPVLRLCYAHAARRHAARGHGQTRGHPRRHRQRQEEHVT